MRTGKTKVVVDTAFHLWERGEIGGLLVVAPNGVHSNWIRRELPKHAWHDEWTGTAWRSSERGMEERALRRVTHADFPILAVNSEALQLKRVQGVIRSLLKACEKRVMLVADESHDFRRPGSRRTKLARTLAKRCSHRRILTGTPVLNSPLHAFSQFELLEPGALGFTRYDEFKARYAVEVVKRTRKGRSYPAIDRYINLEELRERMAPWSSVVLRDEADLPELIEAERGVELSVAQVGVYKQLAEEWVAKLDSGEKITVVEGGARMLKFQQVMGGFMYDQDGEAVSIDDNPPRLDAMWDQVMGTLPGKSIVWCRFREDIRRVCARLRREGVGYVEYHGGVPHAERDEAEDRLRDDPAVSTLVGTPGSAGQGRDFSAADAIIWYSHSHDAILRDQASERATEMGGRPVSMVDLCAYGTVDDGILSDLRDKRCVSQALAGEGLREFLRAN